MAIAVAREQTTEQPQVDASRTTSSIAQQPSRNIAATFSAIDVARKVERAAGGDPAEGILLWLGFVLVNVACWGILEILLNSSRYLGLLGLLIYTMMLMSMARGVGGLGRFQPLRNTLWILAGLFIYIIGREVVDIIREPVRRNFHLGSECEPILMLLLAVGPMLLFALSTLCNRGVPGLFVNLYFGSFYAAIMAWDVVRPGHSGHQGPVDYYTWNLLFRREDLMLLYCGATYALLTLLSLFFDPLPCRLQVVKPWVAGCAAIPLWLLLHIYLGITFEGYQVSTYGNWSAYASATVFQIVIALIISERLPMILAGISLLIMAERVSRSAEVRARDWFASSENVEDMAVVARLSALAAMGACILLLSILYASRRGDIDRVLRKRRAMILGRPMDEEADGACANNTTEIVIAEV